MKVKLYTNSSLLNWEIRTCRRKIEMDMKKVKWTREPRDYSISEDKIEIITKPKTDLWQRICRI